MVVVVVMMTTTILLKYQEMLKQKKTKVKERKGEVTEQGEGKDLEQVRQFVAEEIARKPPHQQSATG